MSVVRVQAGYTPLHTACHFGQVNVVEYLLRHAASTEAVTKVRPALSNATYTQRNGRNGCIDRSHSCVLLRTLLAFITFVAFLAYLLAYCFMFAAYVACVASDGNLALCLLRLCPVRLAERSSFE